MARPIKPASEVHAEPIAEPKPEIVEAAEPPPVENQPEPTPEPESPPKPSVRFQINQIQNCVFADGSSYLARIGVFDISDERLIRNLTAYATFPGSKRQIFILS